MPINSTCLCACLVYTSFFDRELFSHDCLPEPREVQLGNGQPACNAVRSIAGGGIRGGGELRTMNAYKMLLAFFSAVLVLQPACFAQDITVSKTGAELFLLDVSGFKSQSAEGAPALFRQTMESDLARSGWFTIISSGRAEFTIVGASEQDGSSLRVRCEAYHVITQDRYLGKTYQAAVDDARKLAHRVSDDIVFALTGQPGIACTRIVMVGTRTGQKELYVCDADGKNFRQLTNDKTVSVGPKWGPDGTQLVYTSYRSQFPDVYLTDLTTGTRKCIARYPGLNACPAISPDGRTVALILSKEGNPDLFVKDLSSGRLTRLTSTKQAAEASPSWSPDGTRIVFVSDTAGSPQLYIISKDGKEPKRVTGSGSENVDPDWGLNGFIAYSSRAGQQYQICVLNPETLDIRQVTQADADYEDPSWAPDGRHIVCVRTQRYRSRIFIIDTMSSSCINLLPDSETGEWYSPDWSAK